MKLYILRFSIQGEREFLNLPKNIQERIKEKMEFFVQSDNPLHFAKKLQGSGDKYRFRIGDYRVIVEQQDRHVYVILVILKVAHRRDVYE